ncbi:type 1 glutamine amidotransferase domain-containing protein [Streptomyces sp. NPDC001852]|uniref:type 1 glutamine amidotransferase domain-containing protein n=1 Tax=Streptomyces sp. NPDC001852 TaxID=3364619 RepID=UPI0036960188
MPHILMLLSAATRMSLTNGGTRAVGFWPEEVVAPLAVFDGAGARVTVATPDGRPAVPDPAGFTPEGTGLTPPQCEALRRDVDARHFDLSSPEPLGEAARQVYDAVFIPGGYAPMVDLWRDPQCGRVVAAAHRAGRPVAAVCHGPAALLSCTGPTGAWPFAGYRMTSFTDDEEKDVGLLDLLPWTSQRALTHRGARFLTGPGPWQEHVVEDRGLLTGQNPASAGPLAARLLTAIASGHTAIARPSG